MRVPSPKNFAAASIFALVASTLFILTAGANEYAAKPPIKCQTGDLNRDGVVNEADINYLISLIYTHGPAPLCSADVNGDCIDGDQTDMFYLINYVTAGGPPPVKHPCPSGKPKK